MRRCLVRLQAATQKGLEVPSSSQQLNTSTRRTITSKQGIVSSDLPDVLIPSVQLTPLVLDRATRWELADSSCLFDDTLNGDSSGWFKLIFVQDQDQKNLIPVQDQDQDWKEDHRPGGRIALPWRTRRLGNKSDMGSFPPRLNSFSYSLSQIYLVCKRWRLLRALSGKEASEKAMSLQSYFLIVFRCKHVLLLFTCARLIDIQYIYVCIEYLWVLHM